MQQYARIHCRRTQRLAEFLRKQQCISQISECYTQQQSHHPCQQCHHQISAMICPISSSLVEPNARRTPISATRWRRRLCVIELRLMAGTISRMMKIMRRCCVPGPRPVRCWQPFLRHFSPGHKDGYGKSTNNHSRQLQCRTPDGGVPSPHE